MTLFHMSGTNYAPSYTVDLVAVPAPKPAPKAAPVVKAAPKKAEKKPEPAREKPVVKPAVTTPPADIAEEFLPSGGDEAARLERRKKIEQLQMEAQRLYESFQAEDNTATNESVQPEEVPADTPAEVSTPAGGSDASSNIRFRAYYDRIWAKIRSSWVLPEGVTSSTSLTTVVGIRIAASGEIEQYWIEERSGNDYYDQSALRAIRKASPLPSLPDDISEIPLEVGINFKYPE